jgi:AFG3 family protein
MLSRLTLAGRSTIRRSVVTRGVLTDRPLLSRRFRQYTTDKEPPKKENEPFNVPKGFESFFGKKAGKEAKKSADEAAKQHSKNSTDHIPKPPKGNSSNGGGNKPPEVHININTVLGTAAGTWLLWKLTSPADTSREITWQGFRTQLLDKGLVDKLVVVNRNRVRVYLRQEANSLGVSAHQTFILTSRLSG